MKIVNQIIDTLFLAVKKSTEEFTMPTGKHLLPATIIAGSIFVVTLIMSLFGFPVVLSPWGALLGTVVLGAVCFMERSERSEISNLYRVAREGVKNLASWKKRPAINPSDTVPENNTVISGSGTDGEPRSELLRRADTIDVQSDRAAGGERQDGPETPNDPDLD